MADLVIFGAGDIAALAHYYFSNDSPHRVVAFTVDRAFRQSQECLGLPLIDFEEIADRYPPGTCEMFIALSYARMNGLRAEKYAAAESRGYRLASYVSSRCTWLAQTAPGPNAFVLEDNTVQPFVTIGCNVTLWSGNHIGHHSIIRDHTFISSHVVISGHVDIGESCFIGVNAAIRNGIRIAPRTLVGASASIMRDTEPGDVYLGPPARRATTKSDEADL